MKVFSPCLLWLKDLNPCLMFMEFDEVLKMGSEKKKEGGGD